jgi:hypothetical protein
MSAHKYNANPAAEYYVLSVLYRLAEANRHWPVRAPDRILS